MSRRFRIVHQWKTLRARVLARIRETDVQRENNSGLSCWIRYIASMPKCNSPKCSTEVSSFGNVPAYCGPCETRKVAARVKRARTTLDRTKRPGVCIACGFRAAAFKKCPDCLEQEWTEDLSLSW